MGKGLAQDTDSKIISNWTHKKRLKNWIERWVGSWNNMSLKIPKRSKDEREEAGGRKEELD